MTTKKLNGHEVELSHEDKLYFPLSKITKGEILDYYEAITPYLLPYIHNRPITMDRFPGGITGQSFYQKNAGAYFPDWIETKTVINKSAHSKHSVTQYVVCQNAATLVYIANQGCITPHMWLSKIDKLNYPDVLIFDLDPAGHLVKNFKLISKTAVMLKAALEKLELTAYLMTTGSRGLHVRVDIKRELTFDEVRAFAKTVAKKVVEQDPMHLTLNARKEQRVNKILIDIMRNSFGATAVVPYAVRAREDAPVATPLEWHELNDPKLRSDTYTIKNIFKRLDKTADVWKTIDTKHQSLKNAISYFDKLINKNL